jgi:hypothetical protein
VKTFYNGSSPSGSELYLTPEQFAAIQSEIKDEIHADRKDLHQLREIEVSHEPSVRRWLQTEIAVLEARLAFPTNEVLIQLDEMLDTREALNRWGKRRVLARLHARLAELQPGG